MVPHEANFSLIYLLFKQDVIEGEHSLPQFLLLISGSPQYSEICATVSGCNSSHKMLQNSENPALNISPLALLRLNIRVEMPSETSISIRTLHPFGDSECILLVGRSPCAWE